MATTYPRTPTFFAGGKAPRFALAGFWFLNVLVVAGLLFYAGLNTPHGSITLQLSPEKMASILGGSDAGSSLNAALDQLKNGTLSPAWVWVLNLWPPGMVWLEGAILKFSPFDFGVSFALVVALVWGTALTLVCWPFLRGYRSLVGILLVELLILGTSPFQSWMFDESLFYADGLAAAFLVIAVAILAHRSWARGPIHLWIRDGVLSGLAFAAVMYFRSSYQLVPWAMGGLLIILLVLALLRRKKANVQWLLRQCLILGVVLGSVGLMLQPYITYLAQTQNRTTMVVTEDLVFAGIWRAPQDKVPAWVTYSGGTVGCDVDPQRCAELYALRIAGNEVSQAEYRASFVNSVLKHPDRYVSERLSLVTRQWQADESAAYSASPNLNPAQGTFYFVMLLGALVASALLARKGNFAVLLLPAIVIAVALPMAVSGVEARYFIPLKMLALLAPMLLLMARTSPKDAGVEKTFDAPPHDDA
ncbi:MAG: hypothetical protein JJE28_00370 [Actinomycetales bacterium]|nr:hypothetical protein [Actinomycetales bacterium]